jgi:predicted glycosyltransferase
MKKRFLFYFVHPAKFHQLRITINKLIDEGHKVDIIITGRDILEELVVNEGWEYKKIFPNGRKLKGVHIWISAAIFIVITIIKLLFITKGKKYDFFITDDLLTFVGRIKHTPTVCLTDDDLSAVPEAFILMLSANYILAPDICDLGRYNKKKLSYHGYKSIFHLHPNHFTPEVDKLPKEIKNTEYFFIRTVSATSTHDVGKRGIDDVKLRKIVALLSHYGKVIINSERELPDDLQQYVLNFKKNDISHVLAYSKIFVSDSTTMCAEAAMLGVPSIECDDWFGDFKQYYELHEKYKLLYGYGVNKEEENKMFNKISELLTTDNLSEVFQERRNKMLSEKIDASSFFIWFLINYPDSSKEFFKNKKIQFKFK